MPISIFRIKKPIDRSSRKLTLRDVFSLNMHHIDCLDSRAFPDPSGARCQCIAGYAPPEPCKIGDRNCACYSCKAEYSEHHHSLDGQSCEACAKGETADKTGIKCIW